MGNYIGDTLAGGCPSANIATATTTVVKAAPGVLNSITVNTKGSGSTATVYDNATAGSGTKLATIDTGTSLGTFTYNAKFSLGLTIVTVGTADITVGFH